jgi:putative ABC transport system permease protein
MTAALLGIAAGFALAAGLVRFVSGLLYEVTPSDLTTYATVTGLLLGVSLLACYTPARGATQVDPILALRCE